MESKGVLEDWKSYTIRDKILLSSSIAPLIVFVLSFILMVLYIFEEGRGDVSKLLNSETCGKLTFRDYGGWSGWQHDDDFCSVDLTYAIHPNFLLLSTISLGIYGFFSIKSNKDVSNLFLSETSSVESSKSVFLYKYYINVLSVIFLVLIFMFSIPMFDVYEAYPEVDESAPDQNVEVYSYCPDLERFFSLTCYTETYAVDFNGWTSKEYVGGNLLSFLFLPNFLATLIFAYKSRNEYNLKEEWDNLEIKTHDSFEEYYAENIKKREDKIVTETDIKSRSGESSPVVQKHVFLLITIVGGMFGLDKAYKGDYVLAVLKFLTLGGLWIWQIYDIYVAAGEAGRSWSLDPDSSLTTKKHVILVTAIVGGHLGLDRAYKGDGVTGIFKLLTLGGLGIWWLVDVYVAAKEAGESW